MRIRTIALPLLMLLSSLCGTVALAETWHEGKKIAVILRDSRDCTLFTLDGVSQADPVTPGVAWFALAKTHPAYQDFFSMLLTAKASGASVDILASGQLQCGHAAAERVVIH